MYNNILQYVYWDLKMLRWDSKNLFSYNYTVSDYKIVVYYSILQVYKLYNIVPRYQQNVTIKVEVCQYSI